MLCLSLHRDCEVCNKYIHEVLSQVCATAHCSQVTCIQKLLHSTPSVFDDCEDSSVFISYRVILRVYRLGLCERPCTLHWLQCFRLRSNGPIYVRKKPPIRRNFETKKYENVQDSRSCAMNSSNGYNVTAATPQ